MAPTNGNKKAGSVVAIAENEEKSGMSADDVSFMVDCLKNVASGEVKVDTAAVAKARNLKNAGSVANRIAKIRKKFDLPISAAGAGAIRKIPETAEASASKTPSKNKVTKSTSTRGRAIPKKAVQKVAHEVEISSSQDDDSSDGKNTKTTKSLAKSESASKSEEDDSVDDNDYEDAEEDGDEA